MKLHPDKKLAGILEPVFAMRTETDLGIGDTEGVRQMIDWCHRYGLSILQLLPINETSDDNSPYNAISSMAIEPTTIATTPEQLPDLSRAKYRELATPDRLTALRQGAVRYPEVKQLKRSLLRAAFDAFRRKHWKRNTARAAAFRAFLQANADWISDYAMFRVLMEDYHDWPTWDEWPADRQTPKGAWTWYLGLSDGDQATVSERLQFAMYIQWIAFQQWQAVKEYGTDKQVYLMGDIPFGVCRYSADVWANRGLFDLDWNGGAPPETGFASDPFTAKWGQNWGIPLYRWDVMRERGFDWWRTRIGNVHKVFHLFRIDHLLGFFRIYSFPWPPKENDRFLPLTNEQAAEITGGRLPGFRPGPDDSAEQRAVNQQQGTDLLRMVIAAAGDTTVVAEDLGLVPDYVPGTLEQLEIPGFKIPHFLREPHGSFVDGSRYPRVSLATIATHDHPPIASAWRDLWRRVDEGDDGARHELGLWMKYAGQEGTAPPREFAEFHRPILRAVLASNSWLAVFMITDLFAQEARFNAPGAVTESNWSHRMELTVTEMGNDPALCRQAEMMAALLAETDRLP